MPVIGFLSSRSAGDSTIEVAAFQRGLSEAGYTDGRNVAIEYRWANGRNDRLPSLAAHLVARRVAVIAALGGPATGLAVKAATSTIPFVFATGIDPVKLGLVSSINRPGGNATGVNNLMTAVEAKRLGLLHELVPSAALIAAMVNPNSPEAQDQMRDVEGASRSIGVRVQVLRARTAVEIDAAFSELARNAMQALLVCGDPFFNNQRERIVTLAARYSVPAIYEGRNYAKAGGLMSYGPNLPDMYRQVGNYVGQILKGVQPSDLPVVQPTNLVLVINLKTAKALGLTIPPMLLARADEVIE
jgi:putative ABC transport system substrate-binding protein